MEGIQIDDTFCKRNYKGESTIHENLIKLGAESREEKGLPLTVEEEGSLNLEMWGEAMDGRIETFELKLGNFKKGDIIQDFKYDAERRTIITTIEDTEGNVHENKAAI